MILLSQRMRVAFLVRCSALAASVAICSADSSSCDKSSTVARLGKYHKAAMLDDVSSLLQMRVDATLDRSQTASQNHDDDPVSEISTHHEAALKFPDPDAPVVESEKVAKFEAMNESVQAINTDTSESKVAAGADTAVDAVNKEKEEDEAWAEAKEAFKKAMEDPKNAEKMSKLSTESMQGVWKPAGNKMRKRMGSKKKPHLALECDDGGECSVQLVNPEDEEAVEPEKKEGE